jgi:hypothetical protein
MELTVVIVVGRWREAEHLVYLDDMAQAQSLEQGQSRQVTTQLVGEDAEHRK